MRMSFYALTFVIQRAVLKYETCNHLKRTSVSRQQKRLVNCWNLFTLG